jgi:hypothetical protein
MAQGQKSPAMRGAVIGLVGTILTVCGGLTGAGISAAAKIYQIERETQQVNLAPSASEQALSIDTGTIFISRQQAAALDPESYFVDLDLGLVIRRPLPGWDEPERLTVGEVLAEEGAATPSPPLSEQPIYRIRYGEPVVMQSDRHMLVNGLPLTREWLDILVRLYGPEPWTISYYSQVTINVFDRSVVEELGINDLPDLLLTLVSFSGSRVNRLIAEDESNFMVVQSSATYEDVKVAGKSETVIKEAWFLVAETEDAYYTVEITYLPLSGQSVQVWEDLQAYMDSFRVIR